MKTPESVELPQPMSHDAVQPRSKWAVLAASYREHPAMRGDSEEVNTLLREVRAELAL